MRVLASVGVALAALLTIPQAVHAKIRFNRGTIVSVSVSQLKNVVFGSIKASLGPLMAKKRETISARITKQTTVSGAGRRGGALTLKDLKPGMAVEITITGQRVGDPSWEARSIRILDPVNPALEPRSQKKP